MLGKHQPGEETKVLLSFTRKIGVHQDLRGYLFSNENPFDSALSKHGEWNETFGSPSQPKDPWRYHRSDGCQLGMCYAGPGRSKQTQGDPGRPRQTQAGARLQA